MNEIELFEALRDAPIGTFFRTNRSVARKWLMENRGIVIGGTVYHFVMKHLGLGVYQVSVTVSSDTWMGWES